MALLTALLSAFTATAQSWAMPKVSVTILRSSAGHSAEQVSQVVMGTPLKVLVKQDSWWKIETPEGYTGYVRNNTLQGLTDSEMTRWRTADRGVISTDCMVYALASAQADANRVTDLVNGVILELDPQQSISNGMVGVILPDGRKGFVEQSLIQPIEQWANQQWDPAEMPRYAARMMGAPYVWGGTSLKGMDCSGLTQICGYRQGIMLPRDASQQVKVGTEIDRSDFNQFQPGDLLFFGNVKTGRINHVAISMGGGRYIHSSARVRVSSLDPSAADYENPGLIAVRRIDQSTAESLSLGKHPWYFSR